LKAEERRLKAEIESEQDEIKKIIADTENIQAQDTLFSRNGFVTFETRKDAERARGILMSNNELEFTMETPPHPDDVRYHELEIGGAESDIPFLQWIYQLLGVSVYHLVGYALIVGLAFAYMPIVLWLGNSASKIAHMPIFLSILKAVGLERTILGVLASIGVTIMMAFLPTLLHLIFRWCFSLKGDRWSQLLVQEYYFWFLMVFVLLISAIGHHLGDTLNALADSPFQAFRLLATRLPFTTHFYLGYCLVQPVTHAMNLTRYFNLLKFFIYKQVVDETRALELSEPEDQEYYGMGSRSARFTLMLVIALVFGTICPLMYVVVLINFLCCRLFYGYLIPYAERRKCDMGGAHWCMQLRHVHLGLLVYIVMMTGVLLERADSKGPSIIAAISFLIWFISYRKFRHALQWETLPYVEVPDKDEVDDCKYQQKELVWPPPKEFG
jgi:hypothetical protein